MSTQTPPSPKRLKLTNPPTDAVASLETTAEYRPRWVFEDGDVEFIITPEYIIRVDSCVLRIASRFFAACLNPSWSQYYEGDDTAANDRRSATWTFVLEQDENDSEGHFFKRKIRGSRLAPIQSLETPLDPVVLKSIENLFLIYCHQTPQICDLNDILALIRLADKYDSLPCVSRAIRARLFDDPMVWEDIKEKPSQYLLVAEKIKSSAILKEAAVHIIGRWEELSEGIRGNISHSLFETLRQKRADQIKLVGEVNIRLLSLGDDDPWPEFDEEWVAWAFIRQDISRIFRKYRSQKINERLLYKDLADVGEKADIDSFEVPIDATWDSSDISLQLIVKRDLVRTKICDLLKSKIHNTVDLRGVHHLVCTGLDEGYLPWDKDFS